MTQPATAGEHAQAAQAGLAEVVASALAGLTDGLDLSDSQTVRAVKFAVRAVVGKYSPASAVLAVRAYQSARRLAGIRRPFTPRPAPLPLAVDVDAAVEWAVSNAVKPVPDVEQVQGDVVASAQKFVHDTGRNTIVTNVHRDRQAIAWARVPEPALTESGTCSFCAMLCARGAVYKEDTVDFKAHVRHNGSGHNCVCHPEPVFNAYEPSARVREWQRLWDEVGKPRSGADARAAFRQAIEGRPVTGLTRGPNVSAGKAARRRAGKPESEPVKVKVSADDARHMISLFEQSNKRAEGNPKLAGMVKANNARIAQLQAAM